MESEPIRKILIVRTSALGDIIHVLPSLEALRRLFPAAEIHWVTEPAAAGLLEVHPDIARVTVIPRQRWKKSLGKPSKWPSILAEALSLSRALRRERFDIVIDFHCGLRSSAILFMAGGRVRVGFHPRDAAETGGTVFTRIHPPPLPGRLSKVEKNLALVRALGFRGPCPRGRLALPEEDRAWAREMMESLPGAGPSIAIHPAVSRFGEIKRWPAEKFRRLVDLLREKHDARVLITWGPGERPVAESIGRPTLLPAEVPIRRFAAILEAADLVIAADTGALPMATILGTPAVGIFGPKDPVVYGPYPSRAEIVTSPAPCSPCKLRVCEHAICMELVQPADVLLAAERALERGRSGKEGAAAACRDRSGP